MQTMTSLFQKTQITTSVPNGAGVSITLPVVSNLRKEPNPFIQRAAMLWDMGQISPEAYVLLVGADVAMCTPGFEPTPEVVLKVNTLQEILEG